MLKSRDGGDSFGFMGEWQIFSPDWGMRREGSASFHAHGGLALTLQGATHTTQRSIWLQSLGMERHFFWKDTPLGSEKKGVLWSLGLPYSVVSAYKIQPHAPYGKTLESDPCFWLAFCMSSDCLGNVSLLPAPSDFAAQNLFNVTMHSCLDFIVRQVQVRGPEEPIV